MRISPDCLFLFLYVQQSLGISQGAKVLADLTNQILSAISGASSAPLDLVAARKSQEEMAQKKREREEMELERNLDDDVGQSHTDSLEQVCLAWKFENLSRVSPLLCTMGKHCLACGPVNLLFSGMG